MRDSGISTEPETAQGREASDVERLVMCFDKHPKCSTCDSYDDSKDNKGFCNQFSRQGESPEANSATAYDNFWVDKNFYCARHSDFDT